MYECPNCRERQSWRYVMKSAWGTWTCRACGALVGIDSTRRVIGLVVVLILTVLACTLLGGRIGLMSAASGELVLFAMLPIILAITAFIDRVVLIVPAGTRCRRCGYDLHGLRKHRCPECGEAFDPADWLGDRAERTKAERLATRRRSRRWMFLLAIFFVVLLAMMQLLYVRSRRASTVTAPAAVSPSASPAKPLVSPPTPR